MKVRLGNVSNSSSSSFVISGHELTECQRLMIENHVEQAKLVASIRCKGCLHRESWSDCRGHNECDYPRNLSEPWLDDMVSNGLCFPWRLSDDLMSGDVMMDNFDMVEFLIQIGVPGECIKREHDNDNW